jgi:hypothetical protein
MAKSINWFRLNRNLHRDIGYFCVGLTLIFAISGIALNHVNDWDPNYQVTQTEHAISDIENKINNDDFEPWLLKELNLSSTIKARFWQSPTTYKLFTKNNQTLIINIPKSTVVLQQISPRFLLKSFNFLHLNEARNAWTYYSDFYAALLIYLALSALFMVKGKKGIKSSRGLLVIAGFFIPAAFVVGYAY